MVEEVCEPQFRSQDPRKGKANELVHELEVSLEQLYTGKTMQVQVRRNTLCSACQGKKQTGVCVECEDKETISESEVLEVHVERGTKDGKKIVLHGEGHRAPSKEPGDVVIVIKEKPHERFRRRGQDLLIDVSVDLLTAILGGPIKIKHLNNRVLVIHLQSGDIIRSGDTRVIRGQGIPSHQNQGDLHVKFYLRFPDRIDPASIPLLERTLPRNFAPNFDKGIIFEEVELWDTETDIDDVVPGVSAPVNVQR